MSLKSENNTIAFVSKIQHLNYLNTNQMLKNHGKIHFICLTPSTEYEAKRIGVCYTSGEDIYDMSELNTIGAKSWNDFEDLTKYIDSEVNNSFNGICDEGFFSSIHFTYLIKQYHDTVMGLLYKLLSVTESTLPSKVICFKEDESLVHFDLQYNLGDLIFKILELLKEKYNFDIVNYCIDKSTINSEKISHRTDSQHKIKLKFLSFFEEQLNIQIGGICPDNRYILVKIILGDIIDSLIYNIRRNPKLKKIAIGRNNTLAQLTEYVKGWQLEGGNVKSISKLMDACNFTSEDFNNNKLLKKFGITSQKLSDFCEKREKDSDLKKYFIYKNINFFPIVFPWLKQFLCYVFPSCVLSVELIEKKLKDQGISVYFTPSSTHKTEISAILACKRLGIKIYSVQHGSMGFFKSSITKYSDYLDFDYALVYGEGVEKYFKRDFDISSTNNLANPVAVGNPLLQEQYSQQRSKDQISQSNQKRILYIPTHFERTFTYYGWNCYPNIWYSKFQRRLVDTIHCHSDVSLFIKPYPNVKVEDPLTIQVRNNCINNVTFLPSHIDMKYYMDKVDLFISDFPGTGLLNMLCTKKPVIVYFNPKYFNMPMDAFNLLKNRVELCNDEEKFFATLKNYCKKDSWPAIEEVDDSFLYEYGICGNDINSSQKVINHLLSN